MGRDYPTGVCSLEDYLGAFRFYGEDKWCTLSLIILIYLLFQDRKGPIWLVRTQNGKANRSGDYINFLPGRVAQCRPLESFLYFIFTVHDLGLNLIWQLFLLTHDPLEV